MELNHNASERNRRKKINNLYSSLLPDSDRMKKLSIPVTVACVVKYIPELQKEVESLVQKKEELSSAAVVTVSPVGGGKEVVVQISNHKADKGSLISEALNNLELGHGIFLLNASSFQSNIGDS